MKKFFMTFVATLGLSTLLSAQYTKDGRPDMRYKANKEMYGSYYSSSPNYTPSPSYNSSPNYTPSPSYKSSPNYTPPTYTNPYTGNQSSYPSYPTKKNGTPDMRYKENKQLYPYGY